MSALYNKVNILFVMGMKNKHLIIYSIFLVFFLLLSGCATDQNNPENTNENSDETNNNDLIKGSIIFEYPPFDLDKIYYILPMGFMDGGHVTPVDHQYYIANDETWVDVYSPADGFVDSIQHMDIAADDNPIPVDDYRITIQHTTTISSYYIHIDMLSEKLLAFDPGLGNYANVNIEVNAGEIIGNYTGSVDYIVVDEDVELDFIKPSSYEREPWKIRCPDPFDYFKEEIKNKMINKCLRTDEPLGGKICYDIDGKLVGTWFEEETNGYQGVDPDRYWAGHLSIVYNYIDPDAIIISIGTFIDTSEQFAVKDNSPDPAEISTDDGLVIYELTDYEYYKDDTRWDRNSLVQGLKIQNGIDHRGTILLQLIEDQKLKVEIFPNETATNFTENAKIYVR